MYATCFVLNALNSTDKCPDFAIQIWCDCDCPQTISTSSTTKHTTSGTSGGSVTGIGSGRSSTVGKLMAGNVGRSDTGSGTGGSKASQNRTYGHLVPRLT
ncbi:hypothetical protein DPMN_095361 [Dreissena polymorpha]|uniref:Uncharacterized protein n=1 Tax=Dreissena polymorpha TaxID=45954 RepID=A0A9D4R4D9_DREPO|nr:hypothetical protein DPMN_095361 [Dreissena polymorpha]